MIIKRAVLLLIVAFGAIFAFVSSRTDATNEAIRRYGVALDDLSLTLSEMERGFPGLVGASAEALEKVRAMRGVVARVEPLASREAFKGLQDGHRYTEIALETSAKLLGSSALVLTSERKALDLLREGHRALSASRVGRAERETIAACLVQVGALMQTAESMSRLVGPAAETQASQLADMHSQMQNLLVLSGGDADLRNRLTALVLLLDLAGESSDHVRQVHAFCENFAKRLRYEEGVLKSLSAGGR